MPLGRVLRGVRAGESRSVWFEPGLQAPEVITLTSSDFEAGGAIPPGPHRGGRAGQNLSPELSWSGVPEVAEQLLLLLEDVDVPMPRPAVHTLAVLDPQVTSLARGALTKRAAGIRYVPAVLRMTGYQGPQPLPGHGVHRYGFQLFALDRPLGEARSVRAALAEAAGHVIGRGRLIGTDER